MLQYLYIPEDCELDDGVEFAINNKISQIIHGKSDIINDIVQDFNVKQVINIPEKKEILNKFLVFAEKENFNILFLDEFSIDRPYESLVGEFYLIDESLGEKKYMSSVKLEKINNVLFSLPFSLDKYGEYYLEILVNDNDTKRVVFRDTVIIYKEYDEDERYNDKFFFQV